MDFPAIIEVVAAIVAIISGIGGVVYFLIKQDPKTAKLVVGITGGVVMVIVALAGILSLSQSKQNLGVSQAIITGTPSSPAATETATRTPTPTRTATPTPTPTATPTPSPTATQPPPSPSPCTDACSNPSPTASVTILVTGWNPAKWTNGANASIHVHTSAPNDGFGFIFHFPSGNTWLSASTDPDLQTDGSGNGTYSFTIPSSGYCVSGQNIDVKVQVQEGNSLSYGPDANIPCG